MSTFTKHSMYFGALFALLITASCSEEDDPTPTNGQVTVTINDPDGQAAAGTEIQFFATEADATNSTNRIQTFTGNAQGVVEVDIAFGSYFVRITSSDALLLDVIADVSISETNPSQTVDLAWDAEAFVVGDWDLSAMTASTSIDDESLEDTTPEGENYSFAADGSYALLVGSSELFSDTWIIDAEESLIRLGGTKVIVESYASDLNQTISVPTDDIADVETYAVTTNSRNEVVLESTGSFTIDTSIFTYVYRFTLRRR